MDDKRLAIIKATGRLLEAGGQITVDKVAVEAGVAKGTVYLYFNSKQELIQEAFFAGIDELCEAVDSAAVSTPGNSFDRIAAMVNVHYQLVSGKVLLMHRFFAEEPEIMQNMKGKMGSNVIKSVKRIEGRYAEELQRGIDSQEFRPHQTEIIAAALMAMLHNLSAGQIFRTHLDEKQIVLEVLEMVVKGIANTKREEA